MRARLVIAATFLASIGCTALIGVRDLTYDENAPDGGGSSSGASSSGGSSGASSSGSSGDGGGDGASCVADFMTDVANCGRCGHDCVGGGCVGGKCTPKTLATGLVNPDGIALDAQNVYVTTYGDGRVLRVGKDGSGLTPLATGQTNARGVAVDGTTLYWSNADFTFSDSGSVGGVWTCPLPGCSPKRLVTAVDMAEYVTPVGGLLYFNATNDSEVRRVNPDGGSNILLATTNQPFGLACDGKHVYYTSSQPNLYRALADGGRNEEAVGALDSDFIGLVAVDNERVYWAYTQSGTGVGKVWSASTTDIAGAKIEYGPNKTGSVGVAVDNTTLYWTNGGTFTGATSNADGELLACPKTGCLTTGPVLLADKLPNPWNVAVDDVAVYWVEFTNDGQSTGTVKKVAKP